MEKHLTDKELVVDTVFDVERVRSFLIMGVIPTRLVFDRDGELVYDVRLRRLFVVANDLPYAIDFGATERFEAAVRVERERVAHAVRILEECLAQADSDGALPIVLREKLDEERQELEFLDMFRV